MLVCWARYLPLLALTRHSVVNMALLDNPEMLLALGSGLLQGSLPGRSLGYGLAQAAANMAPYAAQQSELQRKQALLDKTRQAVMPLLGQPAKTIKSPAFISGQNVQPATGMYAENPQAAGILSTYAQTDPNAVLGLLAKQAIPETQKPTSLMQNLGTIYTPGSPEYNQAMQQILMKPQTQVNMGNQLITPEMATKIRGPNGEMPPIGATLSSLGPGWNFVDPTQVGKAITAAEQIGSMDQAITAYKDVLNKTGALNYFDLIRDPKQYNKLTSAYTNLTMEAKNLFQLGALSGPDMDLITSVLQNPTSIQANVSQLFGGKSSLTGQIDVIRDKLNYARERAKQLYGKNWREAINKPVPPSGFTEVVK